VVAGNPTRREFEDARKRNFRAAEKSLLVMGGSQGARSINRAMALALPLLVGLKIKICHQTGQNDFEETKAAYANYFPSAEVAPFFEDMAERMRNAHLAVARAGASTCAELLLSALPSVLVPYPGAGGHQKHNALSLENCGAAEIADDSALSGEFLAEKIKSLLEQAETLERMSLSAARNARPGAARFICRDIMTELGER
jgi:UDP-N-acetylglucosamine--N-acetylmuramyl-(pentapeptide) pyrophosphoryl-undecaprenol N-acetylglucosamine transferase